MTQVIQQVIYELSRHFSGTPHDEFGQVVDQVNREAIDGSWQEAVDLLVD